MRLLLDCAELLHIHRLHHLLAVAYRWLFKSLAAAQFLNNTGFFKFALEFLQRSFDVLAFFYLYDYHFVI